MPVLRPTQALIQRVKWWSYTPTSPHVFMAWCRISQVQGRCIFYPYRTRCSPQRSIVEHLQFGYEVNQVDGSNHVTDITPKTDLEIPLFSEKPGFLTSRIVYPDDGSSRFLCNAGTLSTKLQCVTSQKTIIFIIS
jgi:hypothetical protein